MTRLPDVKDLFTFIQAVLVLSREQNQIRSDIKDLLNQMTHLILKVQTLSDQIVLNNEKRKDEMTIFRKELEIETLRMKQDLGLSRNRINPALPPADTEK